MTVLGKVGPLMEFLAFRLGSHCWSWRSSRVVASISQRYNNVQQFLLATVEVAEVLQR